MGELGGSQAISSADALKVFQGVNSQERACNNLSAISSRSLGVMHDNHGLGLLIAIRDFRHVNSTT